MDKKASISLFISLGLVLLISFAVFFFIQSQLVSIQEEETIQALNEPLHIAEVRKFVSDCLQHAGKKAIYKVGSNAGYLSLAPSPDYNEQGSNAPFFEYLYVDNRALPLLIVGDQKRLRSKEKIESLVSNYITVEASPCLKNITIFETQGFRFSYPDIILGSPNSTVTTLFQDDVTRVTLAWPITIIRDEQETKIEEFQSAIELRFGFLYSVAENIIDQLVQDRTLNLQNNCETLLNNDPNINVYADTNPQVYEYVVRVVDITPLQFNDIPLRFEFGIRNRELLGECIG